MASNKPSTLTRRHLIGLGVFTPVLFGMEDMVKEPHGIDFVAEFDPMWQRTRVYTMDVAEAMPADQYTYRPVDTVWTFAAQLMHIASSNYGFADVIRGSVLADQPDFTAEGKTRDEILEILNGSFDVVIDLLISLSPAQLEERVRWIRPIGGEATHSKRGVALTIWHHVTHHRAQLVVYLRMNGITPPAYMD